MTIMMPASDQAVLARRETIVADLRAIVPGEGVIDSAADGAAYQIAEIYAWRDEKDKAFEWLERAYRQQDGGLTVIKTDPVLASLRADPRYFALLRKLHLPT